MNWHVFGALRVRLYVLMIAVTYTIFCVNSNDFYIHIRQFKREEGKYTFRRALGNEQLLHGNVRLNSNRWFFPAKFNWMFFAHRKCHFVNLNFCIQGPKAFTAIRMIFMNTLGSSSKFTIELKQDFLSLFLQVQHDNLLVVIFEMGNN